MTQWIVVNPVTREGLVTSPTKPKPELDKGDLTERSYRQILEWTGLLHLRDEVQKAGGGDTALNEIYIRACECYCDVWEVTRPEAESKVE